MKVIALKSFGGTEYGSYSTGDIFELPEGVDWLKAGLVRPLEVEAETATAEPVEKAVKPRARRRKTATTKKAGK